VKLPAALSVLAGLAIIAALVLANGAGGIVTGVTSAGWGIVAVIAMHLPQVFCSGMAWRAMVPSFKRPTRRSFFRLRLIREGVNALLPVAQIGGHFVGARLLASAGIPLSAAGAAVAVDLTMEMLSQVVFTLLGLALLATRPGATGLSPLTTGGAVAALAMLAGLFVLAQRFGLFRVLEGGFLRLARRRNWKGLEDVAGLHLAVVALYRSPRRLLAGGFCHLASWLLGGLEVMIGLRVLGVAAGLRDSLIIESLGQAFRAVGFMVPGGLGVQEGGVLLICGLLGIGPQHAIELSLLRRIRELALGVPGLLAWYGIERPFPAAPPAAPDEIFRETAS
jgi:putative membrane protein